jgi:hypothetical protein
MDWQRYKAICDAPDVCSRWLLEQTLELVEGDDVAAHLQADMARPPIDKPADHRGDAATDMFAMTLTHAEVAALRERLERAAAAGETTSATRGRGLGGFVEAWREYEQYLERRAGSGG